MPSKLSISGFVALGAIVAAAGSLTSASAQNATPQIAPDIANRDLRVNHPSGGMRGGRVVIPYSSMPVQGRKHTNYRIFVPNNLQNQKASDGAVPAAQPSAVQAAGNPPYAGYYFETPASLACIYGLVTPSNGCDPNKVTVNASGGQKTTGGQYKAIAIVDFGHDSSAAQDLQAYSAQFNLPPPNLSISYYPSGKVPTADQGVAGETSLDLDMAHAMSPNAPIFLVEGPYNNVDSVFYPTIAAAITLVQNAGGGVVSVSYGGTEVPGDANYVSSLNTTNAVVFVSSGDDPSVNSPSSFPNAVAVGGTGTAREMQITSSRGPTAVPVTPQFKEEVAWDQGGGGFSTVFPTPSYQAAVAAQLYNRQMRMTPDVAAVADPNTGIWYYCSTGCGYSTDQAWGVVGGTSVAAPLVASMTLNRGPLSSTTTQQLTYIYGQLGQSTYFDVAKGTCGPYSGFTVTTGTAANVNTQYDLCTGVGSPRYTPTSAAAATARR